MTFNLSKNEEARLRRAERKVTIAKRASRKAGHFSFSVLYVSQKLRFLGVLDLTHTARGKIENRNFGQEKSSVLVGSKYMLSIV